MNLHTLPLSNGDRVWSLVNRKWMTIGKDVPAAKVSHGQRYYLWYCPETVMKVVRGKLAQPGTEGSTQK